MGCGRSIKEFLLRETMAKFEGTGEIEIIITPKEFMQNCSAAELIRLKELCKDEFDLVDSTYQPEEEEIYGPPRSFAQVKFNQALRTLEKAWHSLTKIDGDIIEDIAKKHE